MSFNCALRRHRPGVLLGLALGIAPGVARGAVPPVLDRVPADAFAVVAVEDLRRLDENSSQFLAAIEMNAVSTLSQALGAMGLREGLNLRGSAAGVMYPPAQEGATPELLLVVPVSDYAALVKNLRATRDGPVDRFEYAKSIYFARTIDGGYAVAGRDRALVEAYTGTPGQLAGHTEQLGERGREVASSADIVVLADMRETRRLLKPVLGPMTQVTGAFGAMTGGQGADRGGSVGGVLIERIERDADRAVVGVSGGPLGLRVDLATEFRDGTPMRAFSAGVAREGEPFGAFGAGEYFVLGSADFSHTGVRALVEDAGSRADGAGEARTLLGGLAGTVLATDRASIGVFAPPSLFVGLLVKGVVAWESDEPGAGVEAFRAWLGSIDGRRTSSATLATSFRPGAQRIGAVDAAAWSIGAKEGSLGQQMIVLFANPSGPQGFVGTRGRRGLLTWSKDASVFESAARASGGDGPSVGDDLMLQQVRALLPGPRAAEAYLNARPALAQMLAIAGQKADLPEALPPIGVGAVMSGGELHATLFVPAPTIRSSVEIMERVGGAFGR